MAAEILLELRLALEGEFLPDATEVKEKLDKLVKVIKEIGPDARKEAIDANGYETIINAWTFFCQTGEDNIKVLTGDAYTIREAVLYALAVLTPGCPTIVDRTTFVMLAQAFDPSVPESTKIGALKVMRNICIKSEANREALTTDVNIIHRFVNLIKVDEPSVEFIHQWCGALKAFTLNDDETVAYNRSAERKRLIFEMDGIYHLSIFLNKYSGVAKVLNSIVIAITMMATHELYCLAIHSAGAITGLDQILQSYTDGHDRLIINTINCLRYLCVSNVVRENIGNTSVLKHTMEVGVRMKTDPNFMEIIMSCLAYMTLRCPCPTAQFLSEKGVPMTLDIMKKHMGNPDVLKGCCLLLRNVAVLSGKVGMLNILEADGEFVLRQVMQKHEKLAENHVKPALRDLGFEVVFKKDNGIVPQHLDPKVRARLESTSYISRNPPK